MKTKSKDILEPLNFPAQQTGQIRPSKLRYIFGLIIFDVRVEVDFLGANFYREADTNFFGNPLRIPQKDQIKDYS